MGTFSPTRQLSARQLSARQLSANRWCWISSSLEGLRTEDLKSFGFTDQIRRSAVWVVPLKGPASSSLPRTSPCASVHLSIICILCCILSYKRTPILCSVNHPSKTYSRGSWEKIYWSGFSKRDRSVWEELDKRKNASHGLAMSCIRPPAGQSHWDVSRPES